MIEVILGNLDGMGQVVEHEREEGLFRRGDTVGTLTGGRSGALVEVGNEVAGDLAVAFEDGLTLGIGVQPLNACEEHLGEGRVGKGGTWIGLNVIPLTTQFAYFYL